MTLFRPENPPLWAEEITDYFGCQPTTRDEVLQYARVLAARGLPADYIVLAVTKYARIRGEYDGKGND